MASIHLRVTEGGMTIEEMKAGTSETPRDISAELLKEAVEYHGVQSDWNQNVANEPGFIKNKPSIPKYWSTDDLSADIYQIVDYRGFTDSNTGVTGVELVYYDPDDDEEKLRYLIDGPGVTTSLRLFFDVIYPVGTYYETSDGDFDPNEAEEWQGTWEYSGGKWHRTA